MARIGAIDVGSNAIRMKIVDVQPPVDGAGGPRFRPFRVVSSERAPVRLGHDVFTKGRFEPSLIAAACDALKRFREAMDDAKVDRYRAVATSAAREAKNGEVFVERAEREAGVFVDVIEGVEEARLVQLAVCERLDLAGRNAALIDIGGGSTELTLLADQQNEFSRSLPIGTVRLIEAFLDGESSVDTRARTLLREYVERLSTEAVHKLLDAAGERVDVIVGTGGNIETLADLCPIPSAFPEGRAIDVGAMRDLLSQLYGMTVAERIQKFQLRPDRADTIVPAAKVLLVIAGALGAKSISAPGVGLREGVLVDLAREHFVPRDFGGENAAVSDACLRLGRRYQFDERHGTVVAGLATKLFDDLVEQHRLGPRDRILLNAAALLHDVGDFVRYEGHHKHSHYIISHSDLMGLSPLERSIVANIARYHRKSVPSTDHESYRELPREARSKVKLMASLLRVADALDREHLAKVSAIDARVDGSNLVLRVEGEGDRALEEWTVKAKSGLLTDAFGLHVQLEDTRTSKPPVV